MQKDLEQFVRENQEKLELADRAFQDIGFFVERTQDGSPSLRLCESSLHDQLGEPFPGEAMHHSGGAYSETDLIYGAPIRQVLDQLAGRSFFVVGLGMGYIEMSIAKECLVRNIKASQIHILSFESVSQLRDLFLGWIIGNPNPGSSIAEEQLLNTKIIYDEVAQFCLASSPVTLPDLKKFLGQLYFGKSGGSRIEAALGTEVPACKGTFEAILYDAFSAKTSPHLWDEEYLFKLLSAVAAPSSLFSTYACRGALKRALVRAGFVVQVRPGFMGKRNSTYGLRNRSTPPI